MVSYFFVFKQKTAYEMRISDWSSDVCSSDLQARLDLHHDPVSGLEHMIHRRQAELVFLHLIGGNRRGVLEALAIAAAKDVEADRELIAAHLRIGGVLRRQDIDHLDHEIAVGDRNRVRKATGVSFSSDLGSSR